MKREINNNTIIVGDFNTPLKPMDRSVKQKISKKTKLLAPGPITSWEIDGETVETVSDFIFLGSKITTDGDCSHEIKRR